MFNSARNKLRIDNKGVANQTPNRSNIKITYIEDDFGGTHLGLLSAHYPTIVNVFGNTYSDFVGVHNMQLFNFWSTKAAISYSSNGPYIPGYGGYQVPWDLTTKSYKVSATLGTYAWYYATRVIIYANSDLSNGYVAYFNSVGSGANARMTVNRIGTSSIYYDTGYTISPIGPINPTSSKSVSFDITNGTDVVVDYNNGEHVGSFTIPALSGTFDRIGFSADRKDSGYNRVFYFKVEA